MSNFMKNAALDFFIAFGVVLGGTLLAGIGAVLVLRPPTNTMLEIAARIKIWAIVVAIGGTIDPIRVIEFNFLEGHLSPAVKQICYIIFAFLGAHMGTELIQWICKEGFKP